MIDSEQSFGICRKFPFYGWDKMGGTQRGRAHDADLGNQAVSEIVRRDLVLFGGKFLRQRNQQRGSISPPFSPG